MGRPETSDHRRIDQAKQGRRQMRERHGNRERQQATVIHLDSSRRTRGGRHLSVPTGPTAAESGRPREALDGPGTLMLPLTGG
jgi:hypothetical protein